ncbi:MAG: cysteine dioxygenase family protein [bacterium]|nr:cysteine dioxygenase family protein [bacterium]
MTSEPTTLHRPGARRAGLGAASLRAVANAIVRRTALWKPLVRYDADQRWFIRLYRTADVEAWLITWTRRQGLELHDHGGSSAVAAVLEGELTELWSDLAVPAEPLRRRRWATGSVQALGPGHVHDVHNERATPAASLHVYSPPLTAMTFYAHREPGLVRLHSEPARGPERPALEVA